MLYKKIFERCCIKKDWYTALLWHKKFTETNDAIKKYQNTFNSRIQSLRTI